MWAAVCAASRRGFEPLLRRLGVSVPERGESSYLPTVAGALEGLLSSGVAVRSQGAVAVFVDGAEKPPLLLQRADGGFLYAAIDVAALRSRLAAGYDRLVYVTDEAQAHHFRQLFALARLAGWVDAASGANRLHPEGRPVALEHAAFGVVTGEAGGKLSSRDGTELTLAALLDQGVVAARAFVDQQRRDVGGPASSSAPAAAASTAGALLPTAAPAACSDVHGESAIAEAVATSAVRYFDLAHARRSTYAFSFAKVLSLRGNTAAYLMYAATRLRALRRQVQRYLLVDLGAPLSAAAGAAGAAATAGSGEAAGWAQLIDTVGQLQRQSEAAAGTAPARPLAHPIKRRLALTVLQYPEALAASARTLAPHVLADHLFALAGDFHAFYESCRVTPSAAAASGAAATGRGAAGGGAQPLLSPVEAYELSENLELCAATEAVLGAGCELLGVRVLDKM
jgi:arginyl-tRNA synthetase